jgi:hypothetical protein
MLPYLSGSLSSGLIIIIPGLPVKVFSRKAAAILCSIPPHKNKDTIQQCKEQGVEH